MRGLYIILAFLALGCTAELESENARLLTTVDSLNSELVNANEAMDILSDIGATLDSIEEEREMIRIEMVEGGVTPEDYATRIEALNDLISHAEEKVKFLEAKNSRANRVIAKLRADLEESQKTVNFLESVLDTSRRENISLKQATVRQKDQITDLETEINEKREELALVEEQINQMVMEARESEAYAYFTRAEAYEEAANRTKLAPRKKKETLLKALDLYRRSEELGYEKATDKVKELEEKTS